MSTSPQLVPLQAHSQCSRAQKDPSQAIPTDGMSAGRVVELREELLVESSQESQPFPSVELQEDHGFLTATQQRAGAWLC